MDLNKSKPDKGHVEPSTINLEIAREAIARGEFFTAAVMAVACSEIERLRERVDA